MDEKVTAQDLRDSVRDYRHPDASASERVYIRSWWASLGIPNQMVAMFRAAEIEKEQTDG